MRARLALSALFAGLASTVYAAEAKAIYAVDAIKHIMPDAKTSCALTDQCRTPEQAAPYLIKSLESRTTGEIAMVLALIGLESVDLKYKFNTKNDTQGTANMMMAPVSNTLL